LLAIWQGIKVRETKKELGLTERLILAMAGEMADSLRATKRACIIFQTLAQEAGVNVANAFTE
jgi:hypothetical protein